MTKSGPTLSTKMTTKIASVLPSSITRVCSRRSSEPWPMRQNQSVRDLDPGLLPRSCDGRAAGRDCLAGGIHMQLVKANDFNDVTDAFVTGVAGIDEIGPGVVRVSYFMEFEKSHDGVNRHPILTHDRRPILTHLSDESGR